MRVRATGRLAVSVSVPTAMAIVMAGCTTPAPTAAPSVSSTANTTPPNFSSTGSATSQSTSASNTAAPTDLPPSAHENTSAGAESFVKYFYERVDLAWTRPERGTLQPLCLPTSKACEAYEKTADELFAKGYRYETSPLTVRTLRSLPTEGGQKEVELHGTQEAANVVDGQNKVITTDSKKPADFLISLVWQNEWKLSEAKVIQ